MGTVRCCRVVLVGRRFCKLEIQEDELNRTLARQWKVLIEVLSSLNFSWGDVAHAAHSAYLLVHV